ncbi:MAG: thiol:disulfide interchange protein DsbA/DsbL [Methylococcaceae bacterium]|nr:thiol:disulfide interchange protein DsbA/DsbL [Methylococcaceae bacterium]MCI0667292.1 thiol:disulfide interchange protein DsbA/DsbL [Methylococcaceae bacterium]MCI0733806.1 thiol:disulfide interchange protein DsbA/DsbL [Methylococcaceae bacterium]
MKTLRFLGIILGFLCTPAIPAQENVIPDVSKGEGYEKIVPPQPTQEKDKVEVIEFFWYGCPHCYTFEPFLKEWAKNLPENVQLIKQPAIFSPKWASGAQAYFVAEALGVTERLHDAIFDAIQKERRPLETEDQLAEFFAEHGVDEEDFHQAYNSFIVTTRMRQAESMPERYGVTGVPAIAINGKYRSNGTLAKNYPGLISVMNALIKLESETLKNP